jgi:hypothetical protein
LTDIQFIEVKLTKISYNGTLFKFGLYSIPFYSEFGLDRLSGINTAM